MAGAVEETAFEEVKAGTGFAETTSYGNLECGRAKSRRRDLIGSQRVARPSLERGMEAASGKKRTPQHEGVTKGFFFSSGLADVAQRLGPNRKISGNKMKLST